MITLNRIWFCLAFIIATIKGSLCQIPLAQQKEMVIHAIMNKTTAPSYLVVTIINKRDQIKREIATTSNLFAGAIKKEYKLNPDDPRIDAIILENRSIEFEFSNSEALANLNLDLYSENELIVYKRSIAIDSIRSLISGNPAINRKLRSKNKDWMFDYNNEAKVFSDKKVRFMFAHVLFMNGIMTYQSDMAANIVFYHEID
jgi:hypothetical protein